MTAVRAIVLGVSTGGVDALVRLLPALPADFALPVMVVIHISPDSGDALARLLDARSHVHVKEADEGETPLAGVVYLAPPNYHLLVEPDGRLGLSTDPHVNCARPSVDVLFESAARCYGADLAGIILSGAGFDGAAGLACVARHGGYTAAQDPADAVASSMPASAIEAVAPHRVLPLNAMPALLRALGAGERP